VRQERSTSTPGTNGLDNKIDIRAGCRARAGYEVPRREKLRMLILRQMRRQRSVLDTSINT
jgi:hypothetical protein